MFVAYLLEQRADAAARASVDLLDAADRLARWPALGRPGRIEGTREFSVPRWSKIIVYEVRNGLVVVLTLRIPGVDQHEEIMIIRAIDHVQIAIPPGGEEKARPFDAGVLGLTFPVTVARVRNQQQVAAQAGCSRTERLIDFDNRVEVHRPLLEAEHPA